MPCRDVLKALIHSIDSTALGLKQLNKLGTLAFGSSSTIELSLNHGFGSGKLGRQA